MKKFLYVLFIALGLSKTTKSQVITAVSCDWMGLVVNVSDTNIVDIYHSGHYLTHPQEYNFIDWEITFNLEFEYFESENLTYVAKHFK